MMYVKMKRKISGVHFLINTIFHGPQPSVKHRTSHKNSIGTDNRACNLEWATHSENILTTVHNGLNSNCKPVRMKLTNGIYKDFVSITEAARITSINFNIIRDSAHGKAEYSGIDSENNEVLSWEFV
uniref:HNH nuclease domain-containing protein n=1 Tax=Pithovirus LCPAC403 TaxID=2506596 RepID=A0A481ZCL0_9VIRU|nr:MAG: uncharacterized protein LCPAC403_02060 [Pithovirus LCPAC403]